jgi:hypothetical protein
MRSSHIAWLGGQYQIFSLEGIMEEKEKQHPKAKRPHGTWTLDTMQKENMAREFSQNLHMKDENVNPNIISVLHSLKNR